MPIAKSSDDFFVFFFCRGIKVIYMYILRRKGRRI